MEIAVLGKTVDRRSETTHASSSEWTHTVVKVQHLDSCRGGFRSQHISRWSESPTCDGVRIQVEGHLISYDVTVISARHKEEGLSTVQVSEEGQGG